MTPFLKWAGGKRKLYPTIAALMPKTIRCYREPFLGGGAIAGALLSDPEFTVGAVSLSDINAKLIAAYLYVRSDLAELVRILDIFTTMHKETGEIAYKDIRTAPFTSPTAHAAKFIFLNKTCWNGLYRVNKDGQFNVPWGKRPDAALYDLDNLREWSALLNKWTRKVDALYVGSYNTHFVHPGDVMYCDPPYIPITSTSFTAYSAAGFTLEDHIALTSYARDCVRKGATVIISNSDTPVTRTLYQGFELHTVEMPRAINSKGTGRGLVKEIIAVGRPQ